MCESTFCHFVFECNARLVRVPPEDMDCTECISYVEMYRCESEAFKSIALLFDHFLRNQTFGILCISVANI